MKTAVDFDEVLFFLVSRMIEWHDNLFDTQLDYEKFCHYRFFEAFGTTDEEASRRYIDFARSDYSVRTLPILNAFNVLSRRKNLGDKFYIASSSQIEVVESKKQRLENHFPNIFEDFHAANHYSLLDGPTRSKADICCEIGADVMIDDNPKHLLGCVDCVKIPILFGDYPWNKGEFPTLIRAANWHEVEEILNNY